jgi:nucleoside-diphosphate-sugar epimerase
MPTTLVTGANSFLAAPILTQLIDEGHKVVGQVRRAAAGDVIIAEHAEWKDKFSYIIVSDLSDVKQWDDVFKSHGFDHIVHVAAPMLGGQAKVDDYDEDFLKPSVEG